MQFKLSMQEVSNSIPHKNIGVAVIWNNTGQILIDKRRNQGSLGGLWEFPGGKVEEGETIEECIRREIREELAIEVEVREHLITIDHTYKDFRVTLNVFNCWHFAGEPQAIESEEIRWVNLDEIDQFSFPIANIKIIEALRLQNSKS